MRRMLTCLMTAACLIATASLAHAAPGIAMRWDQCYGDGGVSNKNFACDTNAGSETLVLSFKPPADLDQVNGNEIHVDLQAPGSTVPSWWQFKNTGTCRVTSLSVNSTASPNAVACLDEFAGNATSGIGSYNIGFGSANAVHIVIAEAVPTSALVTLTADQEYFALNIVIDHRKTVGTGACSGCVTPMCLLFNGLKITRGGEGLDVSLGTPFAPNSFAAGWQGGSPNLYYEPETISHLLIFQGWYLQGCGLPTPARNQTWGAIKSLYR